MNSDVFYRFPSSETRLQASHGAFLATIEHVAKMMKTHKFEDFWELAEKILPQWQQKSKGYGAGKKKIVIL